MKTQAAHTLRGREKKMDGQFPFRENKKTTEKKKVQKGELKFV